MGRVAVALLECGIDRRSVGHVGDKTDGRGAIAAQVLGHTFGGVPVKINDGDPTTSFGEMVARRFTNAGPTPCHDSHLGTL